MLQDLSSGVIYRNPKAHICSRHAYFPSSVQLPSGELVATFSLGEAFESEDCHLFLSRSSDLGQSWSEPAAVSPTISDQAISEFGRISWVGNQAVLLLVHCDRSHYPGEGLTNPANMGFVPTQFKIQWSSDDTLTAWTDPEDIQSPLEGPCFELCCPITPLSDGRWLLPTSTWSDWDGNLANGYRMLAMVSHDQGRSWPEWLDVMHYEEGPRYYWESKIIELSDGTLFANAWVYDPQQEVDLPSQYALSRDAGQTWTEPLSMELFGQTMTPIELADGRLLNVYRRMDEPGLWAQISRLDGDKWVNEACQPLWGHTVADLAKHEDTMVDHFRTLRFGAPDMIQLDNGEIFLSFWCYEDCVSVIRWFRFRV